jgi:hypothetical protein
MTIFTGLSDILLFFILFILIYALNDSLTSQIILFVFTVYAEGIYVKSVMDGTNESSVQFVFFFGGLVAFTLGNILMWIHDYTETKKAKEMRA